MKHSADPTHLNLCLLVAGPPRAWPQLIALLGAYHHVSRSLTLSLTEDQKDC